MTQAELPELDASYLERGSAELPPRALFHGVGLSMAHAPPGDTRELHDFWKLQMDAVMALSHEDLRNHSLPLARIKKIMKSDEDVRMISAEAPVLFSKACEIFILELTRRAWAQSEANKRRTLQRSDIASAITEADVFDFLVDIVPREGSERGGMVDSGNVEPDTQRPAAFLPPAVVGPYAFQSAPGINRHALNLDPQIMPALYQPQFQQCPPTNILSLNPANSASDCASGTEYGKPGDGHAHGE